MALLNSTRLLAATALALPLVFTGTARAETADPKLCQQYVDRWTAAFNNHDAEALAKEYAQDAILSDANEKELKVGRPAIAEMWPSHYNKVKDMQITVSDCQWLSPDLLQIIGDFKTTIKGDNPMLLVGRYVTIRRGTASDSLIITHFASSKVIKPQ